MYNLSYTQAIEMMQQGKRVKHQYFSCEEWFEMQGNRIVDEEGYPMAGWYRGYDWQDEGWMILDEVQQCWDRVKEIVKEHDVVIVDNFSALEDKVIANYVAQGYDLETMDYFVGITPRSPTIPREKENYNFRITKGRGHNKFQKRKKR